MQKYDKEVLAKDWDTKLNISLAEESKHFDDLKKAEDELEKILVEGNDFENDAARDKVKQLRDTVPFQVQCVWDNLNLRTKHRKVFKT